ncbi:hypothetical protein D1007_42659 [Hordeum vulgare]|nr:hypothetical protein D1007_42659 [Hordeum vulgare]
MAVSSSAGVSQGNAKIDPSKLLERLHPEEDELDNLVWEDEVDDPGDQLKWLALAHVLTEKSFSQGVLIDDMRGAWNPTRDVVWRRVNPNSFSIQFNCLVDWNKAIHQGPWDFRGSALIIAEYDGFSSPESITLDQIETWTHIHKLPDGVLRNEGFMQNMA